MRLLLFEGDDQEGFFVVDDELAGVFRGWGELLEDHRGDVFDGEFDQAGFERVEFEAECLLLQDRDNGQGDIAGESPLFDFSPDLDVF